MPYSHPGTPRRPRCPEKQKGNWETAFCKKYFMTPTPLAMIHTTKRQYERLLLEIGFLEPPDVIPRETALARSMHGAPAFPV